MQKEFYDSLKAPFKEDQKKLNRLQIFGKLVTGIVYVAYPVMILNLFMTGHPLKLRAVIVPAISFAAVTVIRHLLNSPRPYEVFDDPPLIKRHGNGQSMPSRHVFSAFIIAFTALAINIPLGIFLTLVGIALSVVRVVGGVHFVKDVVVAFIIAVISAVIGFIIF